MREIKFRAWDLENKFMVISSTLKVRILADKIPIDEIVRYESDFELMQFTGLTDKNGKEIFEGDILKADNENFVHVIKYYSEFMSFVMVKNNVESDWFHGGNNDYFSDDIKTNYKVIGNIYENPELLER